MHRGLCVAVLVVATMGCKTRTEELPPGAKPAVTPTTSAIPLEPTPSSSSSEKAETKVGPLSFAPIAKKADPSVVTITTQGRRKDQRGLGTGFVVDPSGVIITNAHVVEVGDEIVVQLSDERRFTGAVAGRDPRTDIAVVRIQGAKDLVPITLGDSDKVEVGDWVVAIGNPFGLSHTVSAGIVSGKGRSRDEVPLDSTGYYSFLQTDASINPGNSGGPLLDLHGEVVGMNTAIRGGAQGIGFAIPINMVKQIVPTLLEKGHFTRSALGIEIEDARSLTEKERRDLHVASDKGAVVRRVAKGGPADQAKLQEGDVIVAFDGKATERGSLLQWLASTAGVGKVVTVRVMRADQTFDLPVTLGELKEPPINRRPPPVQPDDDDEAPFGR
jgi:serine protease Do